MIIPSNIVSELPNGAGTLLEVVEYYNVALASLQKNLNAALADVEANPSDPGALARFQAASGDYSTFKSFLTQMMKNYKDINASITRNI